MLNFGGVYYVCFRSLTGLVGPLPHGRTPWLTSPGMILQVPIPSDHEFLLGKKSPAMEVRGCAAWHNGPIVWIKNEDFPPLVNWWWVYILSMEEILHQLICGSSDYWSFTGLLHIPGGAGFLPSTVALEIMYIRACVHAYVYMWICRCLFMYMCT